MPSAPAALAALRRTTLVVPLLAGALVARADVGATLSVQTDARERGVSYSGGRPAAQLGVAWDGRTGWYGGASLAHARFGASRRSPWLRAYGGRVVALRPGLDGEAGLVAHRFTSLPRYDHWAAYAGVLGDGWALRLHHAPDPYGSGQRTLYGELNLRWPLGGTFAAIGHAGLLRSHGPPRWPLPADAPSRGPTRIDLRAGASWQLGDSFELQLAWVATSCGGPAIGADSTHRRTAVLGLSAAL